MTSIVQTFVVSLTVYSVHIYTNLLIMPVYRKTDAHTKLDKYLHKPSTTVCFPDRREKELGEGEKRHVCNREVTMKSRQNEKCNWKMTERVDNSFSKLQRGSVVQINPPLFFLQVTALKGKQRMAQCKFSVTRNHTKLIGSEWHEWISPSTQPLKEKIQTMKKKLSSHIYKSCIDNLKTLKYIEIIRNKLWTHQSFFKILNCQWYKFLKN